MIDLICGVVGLVLAVALVCAWIAAHYVIPWIQETAR